VVDIKFKHKKGFYSKKFGINKSKMENWDFLEEARKSYKKQITKSPLPWEFKD